MRALSTPHRGRRALVFAAAVAALLAFAGLSAGPARAASNTTCTGSSTVDYTPGITTTAHDVSLSETDSYTCTSTDPTLTSGSFTLTAEIPGATCAGFVGLVENIPHTITWNNGESTNVNLSFTDTTVLGVNQITGVGTVTSGEFTGATVTIVWEYTPPNPLECLTSGGVTSQSGSVAVEIIGL